MCNVWARIDHDGVIFQVTFSQREAETWLGAGWHVLYRQMRESSL